MNSLTDKIVIVECYSSSVNYIHDIRERGYEPVLLELYASEEKRDELRAINDKAYLFNRDEYPTVIMAEETYEQTLKIIKELAPVLILPGSDPGLELAMRLSSDLGLRSNPLSLLWRMRDKLTAQETLKEAGIRSIRSSAVRSEDEALAFFRWEEKRKVVIKPTQGAASMNVFICSSDEEVKQAFRITKDSIDQRCRQNEQVIIQEYIEGEEYVVDTISCEGDHVALFGMKYIKRRVEGYGKAYDTDIYFSPDDAEVKEIVDYCFHVLDCLGIRYGAVHSEFMVDENGPVLIEANCRPAGAFQKYSFQDQVMENHETAVALDSYLMDSAQFFARYPQRMHLKQPAVVKQLCLNADIFVKRVRITERLSRLRSFCYAIDRGENCVYPKTIDLDTNGGMIYLTAPDLKCVEEDLAEIDSLEKDGLHELFDWC